MGTILSTLGEPSERPRQAAPRASRGFSEACRDPSVWPELHVRYANLTTDARWRSFLRWLAPRISGLRNLVFAWNWTEGYFSGDVSVNHAQELMALLAVSAHQLRSLEYLYPGFDPVRHNAALPAELGQLSQLTSLSLKPGQAPVTTAQVDGIVLGLPSLQRLALWCGSHQALSDGFPVSLTDSCIQLRELDIRGSGGLGAVPPQLGRLTGLTRLALANTGVTGLPSSMSRLSALRELDVSSNDPELALPPELAACQQLTRLAIWPASDAASPVLAALQSLRFLRISSAQNEQPHGPYWTQLTALTELDIDLETSIGVPAGVGNLSSLRKLHIDQADLDDLPPGPYLSRLESLTMQGSVFHRGVPAALTAATQLRHLDLENYNTGINMTAADVGVLSSMPALQTLRLCKPVSMHQGLWDALLDRLRKQYASQGRAPPDISRSRASRYL